MENKTISNVEINVNKKTTSGDTALHRAAAIGHYEEVRCFIRAGAGVNIQNKDGQTPLFRAAKLGHEKCAQLLIDSGANVNQTDRDGNTALFKAAEAGHEQCVQVLLDSGTNVNHENKLGQTALFRAASKGKQKTHNAIAILIKGGADVNKVSILSGTSVSRSLITGGAKLSEALLKAGADVNLTSPGQTTGLYEAVKRAKIDSIKMFLNAGADVNIPNPYHNCTPLMEAVQTGNMEIVHLLLSAGADVNRYTAPNMDTALLIAVIRNDRGCQEQLIKVGAHVNLINENGNTPLLMAVNRYSYRLPLNSVLKILLSQGAHVNVKNHFKLNAIGKYLQEVGGIRVYNEEALALLTAAGERSTERNVEKIKNMEWSVKDECVTEYFFPLDPPPFLTHLCREAIRNHLINIDQHSNLFIRVPKIGLPSKLTRYLLYNVSLDFDKVDIRQLHFRQILDMS